MAFRSISWVHLMRHYKTHNSSSSSSIAAGVFNKQMLLTWDMTRPVDLDTFCGDQQTMTLDLGAADRGVMTGSGCCENWGPRADQDLYVTTKCTVLLSIHSTEKMNRSRKRHTRVDRNDNIYLSEFDDVSDLDYTCRSPWSRRIL